MKKIVVSILFICSFMFGDLVSDGSKAYNAKNYSKAVDLYKKACDGGNATGCYNLGVMYENGYGVKQDSFKAVDLYKKACDGGYAKGCYNLGVMYYKGQGVKQDSNKALELFGKACDMRYESGCKGYAIVKKELGR